MADDEFNELVKRKFAELERKHGRVPTIPELAASLGVDSRILARKLQKAIATLGTEAQTEGTSAFKSTLSELLSGDILFKGSPGVMDLNVLLLDAKNSPHGTSELRWNIDKCKYHLLVHFNTLGSFWGLFSSNGAMLKRVSNDVEEVAALLEAVGRGEVIDKGIDTEYDDEAFSYVLEDLPYQDPIPEDQLPPNVRPFRKPYQHSED